MLVLKLLCVQVFAFVLAAAGAEFSWRTLLKRYQQWEGLYHYDGADVKCSLVVHSANYVAFSSGHTNTDMIVSSNDNITVTFTATTVWSSQFNGSTDLEFVGRFLSDGSSFYFTANATLDSKHLGTVRLTPSANGGRSNTKTALLYGLAIGIPVVLAILLTIASFLILRWGVKAGYLRHVPMAYKNFINPKKGKLEFEMDHPDFPNKAEKPESHI